jgi:hypothetical protein
MSAEIFRWVTTVSRVAAATIALSISLLGADARADVTYRYTSDPITVSNDLARHQFCKNGAECTGRIEIEVTFPGTPGTASFRDYAYVHPGIEDTGRIQHLSIRAFGLAYSDTFVKDRDVMFWGKFTIVDGTITDWDVEADSDPFPDALANCHYCALGLDMTIGFIHAAKNPNEDVSTIYVHHFTAPPPEHQDLIGIQEITNLHGQWTGPFPADK